jgi:hypothetical protein
MTQGKDRPLDPGAQSDEEDEWSEAEELAWEAAWEAEDERITKCAEAAAEALINFAQIPPINHVRFREEATDLAYRVSLGCLTRRGFKPSRAFLEAERGLRIAFAASKRLMEREHVSLNFYIRHQALFLIDHDWNDALRSMVVACARLTGKSPVVTAGKGRGRRKGDIKDYPLKAFVCALVRLVRDNGGTLTLDVKGRRGTWIKALDMLRPLMPANLIPATPPLSTIEGWIREIRQAAKPAF